MVPDCSFWKQDSRNLSLSSDVVLAGCWSVCRVFLKTEQHFGEYENRRMRWSKIFIEMSMRHEGLCTHLWCVSYRWKCSPQFGRIRWLRIRVVGFHIRNKFLRTISMVSTPPLGFSLSGTNFNITAPETRAELKVLCCGISSKWGLGSTSLPAH